MIISMIVKHLTLLVCALLFKLTYYNPYFSINIIQIYFIDINNYFLFYYNIYFINVIINILFILHNMHYIVPIYIYFNLYNNINFFVCLFYLFPILYFKLRV